MILTASAKINLHLDIGPRRRDGYHSLKTVFQEVGLVDTLHFQLSASEIELKIFPPGRLSTGPDNLIVRALVALQKKLKIKTGIRVHLTKRIPMGAGLGGGSSDAAAALWGGWLLWKGLKKKPKRVPPVLLSLASRLGADVAFFLKGGIAKGEGIGDKLTALPPQPRRWLILVYPRVHVPTPLAYRLLDNSRSSTRPSAKHFNSFEPVILKKYPAIAKAKQALLDLGCTGVMMSGSGSTVFGFVKTKKEGARLLRSLRSRPWDCFLVHTLF